MLRAVRHHTDCPWVLLYIERWLKAPVQMEDGSIVPRGAGTPQGGVTTPPYAKGNLGRRPTGGRLRWAKSVCHRRVNRLGQGSRGE